VTKPHTEMGGRYDNGQKRCNESDVFIKWSGKQVVVVADYLD